MIRKPDDRDFKEGAAYRTLQKTSDMSIAAARKTGRGVQKGLRFWLFGVTAFAFAMSGLSSIGLAALPIILVGLGLGYLAYKHLNLAQSAAKAAKHSDEKDQAVLAEPTLNLPMPTHRYHSVANEAEHSSDLPEKKLKYSGGFLTKIGLSTIFLPGFLAFYFFAQEFSESNTFLIGVILAYAAIFYAVGRIFLDQTALIYNKDEITVRAYWGKSRIKWVDVRELDMKMTGALWSLSQDQSRIDVKAHNQQWVKSIPMMWLDHRGSVKKFREDLYVDLVRYWKAAQERDLVKRAQTDVFTGNAAHHVQADSVYANTLAPHYEFEAAHDDVAAARADYVGHRAMRPISQFGRKGL